jgi:myo-inositol catabolism protein IolS
MTAKKTAGPRRTAKKAGPTPTVEAPGPSEDLPLPGTKLRHPPLGLGLWSLGRWTRDDESRTRATLEHALARGVRWFDTAEVYGSGRSERLLGDLLAHREGGAKGLFLSTKLSWEHLKGPMVRASLLGSLQRLGLPKVDLYLIHAPDPRVPLKETLPALEALYKEGKIGAVGVSNFSLDELVEARTLLKEAPLVVNQIRYNLLEPDEGEPLREYCSAQGIVLEAYTPLARGLLAGRYLDGELPTTHVRAFARDLFDRDRFPQLQARAKELRKLAEANGLPMAALALRWLALQGAAPIFGASGPDQVDQGLAAFAARPDEALLHEAEALARGRHA